MPRLRNDIYGFLAMVFAAVVLVALIVVGASGCTCSWVKEAVLGEIKCDSAQEDRR